MSNHTRWRVKKRRRAANDPKFLSGMIARFLLAVVLSLVALTLAALVFYWVEYGAGENLFGEYVVVYKQYAQIRTVEIDGRMVEQRFYEVEAQPPVSRWQVVLPAILLNNALLLIVLSILAVWYSRRIAGPVYRISKEVRLVLSGHRGAHIQLRKRDEFQDLALLLNRLIDRVYQRIPVDSFEPSDLRPKQED